MNTISINKLASLPTGFQESIIERSRIHCAISNCNTFLTYARKCNKYHKETGEQFWIEAGQNSLLPYYNELLSVEWLANKYSYLWQEKFSKCKLECEKILGR